MNLDAEPGGDLAGAMGRRTHLGQGAQIVLLLGCQAVEAHPEKALVQPPDGPLCGAMNVGQFDCGPLSKVPGFIAPLLQKIGIAPGDLDDRVESVGSEFRALVAHGNLQGLGRVRGLERSNFGILEKTLGIRFGAPG